MSRHIRPLAAATLIVAGAALIPSGISHAHHTDVWCQSPGVWLIENSEADKSLTFTTDQGHAGSIGDGGSTTVEYSGTSLTVYGVWENGATNTTTGVGDCVVVATTTTTVPEETTTTTTTTVAETTTTTTVPDETTTTTAPDTTTTTTTPDVTTTSIAVDNTVTLDLVGECPTTIVLTLVGEPGELVGHIRSDAGNLDVPLGVWPAGEHTGQITGDGGTYEIWYTWHGEDSEHVTLTGDCTPDTTLPPVVTTTTPPVVTLPPIVTDPPATTVPVVTDPPVVAPVTPEPCNAPPGTESDAGCILPILPATR